MVVVFADSVDPARDLDVIHNELRAKDLQRIDGIIASMGKKVRGPEAKKVKAELVSGHDMQQSVGRSSQK